MLKNPIPGLRVVVENLTEAPTVRQSERPHGIEMLDGQVEIAPRSPVLSWEPEHEDTGTDEREHVLSE
jgi:hypothetical protein